MNTIALADENHISVLPRVRSGRFPICASLETTCYELDLEFIMARNGARWLRFVLPVSVYPDGFSRRVEAKREHIMEALGEYQEGNTLTPLAKESLADDLAAANVTIDGLGGSSEDNVVHAFQRYIRMVLYRLIVNCERSS